MTEKELTLFHNQNIIKIQELTIKHLYDPSKLFTPILTANDKLQNRTMVKTLRKVTRVLKKNYKKALKECEEEVSNVADLPETTKDEEDF